MAFTNRACSSVVQRFLVLFTASSTASDLGAFAVFLTCAPLLITPPVSMSCALCAAGGEGFVEVEELEEERSCMAGNCNGRMVEKGMTAVGLSGAGRNSVLDVVKTACGGKASELGELFAG